MPEGILHNGSTYLKKDISRTLLRERPLGFLHDFDTSDLGICDSFYGFWELGHCWVELWTVERKIPGIIEYIYYPSMPLSRSPMIP